MTILQPCLSCATWWPNIALPLLDAVLDAQLAKICRAHVKPRVPGTYFKCVIEDVSKAIIDYVTELNVNIFRPKLPKSRSCVRPNPVIAAGMLGPFSCLGKKEEDKDLSQIYSNMADEKIRRLRKTDA